MKHKSKGNQNPDQIPGQKPDKQNLEEKSNDQNPPKDDDNNKENLPPNNLSNNPNPAPPPQQNIGNSDSYNVAACKVGQQNAQSFVNAVSNFNNDNPGKVLEIDFLAKILVILGVQFPVCLKDNQNFALLANLKQQQNVRFGFAKDSTFGNVHCHVFIGNLVYDFYTYGGADSFNVIMECHKSENNNWPLVEKIKIENGNVQKIQ